MSLGGWVPRTYVWLGHVGTLERYAHSGCVPRLPRPKKGPGFEVRNLGSRRRGPHQDRRLGLRAGELPPIRPAVLSAWHRNVCAVPFREAGWGRRRRGRAPAPKSEGPLLPSRTPNPRNTGLAASGGLYARPCRARMASR